MGIPTLISTTTASSTTNVIISSGITTDYDEYMFVFTDLAGATGHAFQMDFTKTTGEGWSYYDKTWTYFAASHTEADVTNLYYSTSQDGAQLDSPVYLSSGQLGDADASMSGILHLFNPRGTTYVKHFYSRCTWMGEGPGLQDNSSAGYINTTDYVSAVKILSGANFSGVIQMYGIA